MAAAHPQPQSGPAQLSTMPTDIDPARPISEMPPPTASIAAHHAHGQPPPSPTNTEQRLRDLPERIYQARLVTISLDARHRQMQQHADMVRAIAYIGASEAGKTHYSASSAASAAPEVVQAEAAVTDAWRAWQEAQARHELLRNQLRVALAIDVPAAGEER